MRQMGASDAAADHRFGVAALDDPERISNGVRAGGAGGGGRRIGAFGPQADGDVAGGQVHDGGGNEKWRDALGAVIQQVLELALDDFKSADAAADVDAHALRVVLADFQARAGQGEFARRDGEVDEAPHLLDVFALDEFLRLEASHLAGDAAGEGGGVKSGDVRNPAAALANRPPTLLGSDSDGGNKPDTCHHNPARQSFAPQENRPGRSLLLLGHFGFDIVNGILDRADLLGVLIGDVQVEGLLEGHDQLHDVQRISS